MPDMNRHLDSVGKGFTDFLTPPPEGVIRFTVGQPDFTTPEGIREVAIQSLRDGETSYTRPGGSEELCRTVARFLDERCGIEVGWEDVVVTPGCKQALLYALMGLGNPGDEVLLLAPAWPTYDAQIRLVGMTPVHVPTHRPSFHPDMEALEAAVTEKTKFIFLNSPNNPTGAVYTPEETKALVDLAIRHDLWIIDDMIYATMVWSDHPYTSPATIEGGWERTITIGGWSKSWAMTGWRLGFCAGPPEAARALHLCQTSAATHVPTFLMKAAAFALFDDAGRMPMHDAFGERREVVFEELSNIPQLSVNKPEGAFYIIIDITDTGMDDRTFARRALSEAQVQLVPASLMQGGEGYCRISYAASIDDIREGCRRLREWLAELSEKHQY
ncbi:MAG TPA: aminotransferase class I/II-fold pyridoxal phosphate-dependent enzyme [Candidatus Poseidoniales archaeon]|nr:aminotransferase class I/II-fold pyridoxal phosphate-dependent enzyme [Candidatus Poseidoniales archaeon]